MHSLLPPRTVEAKGGVRGGAASLVDERASFPPSPGTRASRSWVARITSGALLAPASAVVARLMR